MTEQEIIEGCKRQDMKARHALYQQYGGVLYGLCCRYLRDNDEAKDLLHDGFVTLFLKINEYRGDGSFEGWCRRVMVNTILGYLRKHNPLREVEDVDTLTQLADDDTTALHRIEAEELMQCIGELPVGYRTILNLYAIEGYPYADIATMMGITEATVRSQYMRAKVKLQKILKEQEIIS